jgi:hypothetical protein
MGVGERGEYRFGRGVVVVAADGAVAAVRHPSRGHSMLLEEDPRAPEAVMHEPARRWGKGFVIAGGRGRRFDAPVSISWLADGVDLVHDLVDLELRISRRVADSWLETYELRNTSSEAVDVASIAVSTPWRDVYGSSRESLRRAVHAHVWTGGADAWVWAVPMDGSGPGLGLSLTEGELWAYSVESRDAVTSSNVRGHLYLHVTDYARSPRAMGGQPLITLGPGQSYRWSWQLDWYEVLADFHATRRPLIDADTLTAQLGQPLELRLAPGATVPVSQPVAFTTPGVQHIEARAGDRRARISVLVHPPLRQVVERRVRFVLDRQRPREAAGSRRFAFVPYDNDAGLTVLAGGWRDWSDARERVGMALLLQMTRERGWGDAAELDNALAGYEQFVGEHLIEAGGAVVDDTRHHRTSRLYNFPWFARFLLDRGDLDRAMLVLDRYYDLGGDHFLAFGLGPLLRDLAARLAAARRPDEAARMHRHLGRHAAVFLDFGDDLPPHEVNYEQSMVAPLLELLVAAYQAAPSPATSSTGGCRG